MGDVIDITELLRNKKWPTDAEKQYVLRHIRTSECMAVLSESVSKILKISQNLPFQQCIPAFALSRLSTATLEFIKEIFTELNASVRIEESTQMKILIAEAMYKELKTPFNDLPQKMDSYTPDEP